VEKGARVWHEVIPRRLGVDSGLESVSDQRDLTLREWQGIPCSDLELPVDKIEASDHLGDRVLDLKTGVPIIMSTQNLLSWCSNLHLHKEEVLSIVVKDKFDCSGANVVHSFRCCNRFCAEICSKSCTQPWCRSLNLH
jgi:hypothetical protein